MAIVRAKYPFELIGIDCDLSTTKKRFERNVVTQAFPHAMIAIANEDIYRDKALVGRLGNEFEIRMCLSSDLLARWARFART